VAEQKYSYCPLFAEIFQLLDLRILIQVYFVQRNSLRYGNLDAKLNGFNIFE